MTDIDVDSFLLGGRSAFSDPVPIREAVRVAEAEAEEPRPTDQRQLTMEGADEPVIRDRKAWQQVAAVVMRSRSGSDRPHVVTILTFPDDTRAVACTCEAMLSVAKRPDGCWAMKYVRDLVRIPPPGGPA